MKICTQGHVGSPFNRQPYKVVKQTQTVRWLLPTNSLSVFDHFVDFMLTGLMVLIGYRRYGRGWSGWFTIFTTSISLRACYMQSTDFLSLSDKNKWSWALLSLSAKQGEIKTALVFTRFLCSLDHNDFTIEIIKLYADVISSIVIIPCCNSLSFSVTLSANLPSLLGENL